MPFIPVANTAMIEAVYEGPEGQIAENTMYFTGGAMDLTGLGALVDDINAAIQDHILPLMHSAVKLVRVVGTLLDVLDGLQVISTTGLPASGGETGGMLPSNVSFAVSFRTPNRGRSARGRNFLYGIPSAAQDTTDSLNSSYVTAVVAAWDATLNAAADDGWGPVVVSRFTGGSPRSAGVTFPITSVVATDNGIDTMRRRLAGHGS